MVLPSPFFSSRGDKSTGWLTTRAPPPFLSRPELGLMSYGRSFFPLAAITADPLWQFRVLGGGFSFLRVHHRRTMDPLR